MECQINCDPLLNLPLWGRDSFNNITYTTSKCYVLVVIVVVSNNNNHHYPQSVRVPEQRGKLFVTWSLTVSVNRTNLLFQYSPLFNLSAFRMFVGDHGFPQLPFLCKLYLDINFVAKIMDYGVISCFFQFFLLKVKTKV